MGLDDIIAGLRAVKDEAGVELGRFSDHPWDTATNIAGRGAAGLVGLPVDTATNIAKLMRAGYGLGKHAVTGKAEDLIDADLPEQRGSSEWIGRKLTDAGLMTGERNPVLEVVSGFAGPAAAKGPALIVKGLRAAQAPAREAILAASLRKEAPPLSNAPRRRPVAAARVKDKPESDPLDVRTIEDAREPAGPAPQAPYIQTSSTSGELPLFDLRPDKLHPADVVQEDLYRQQGRGGKHTERMQALLDSPTARSHIDKLIQKGRDINPMLEHWYGNLPLREAFGQENAGLEDWPRFMAHMQSASQRNPVDQQNKMGSLMWMMDRQSMFDPDIRLLTNAMRKEGDTAGPLIALPEGYGSLAQGDIFKRAKQLAMGEDPMMVLPEDRKLGSFLRNQMGNYRPVTVDVNAVKGPAIMSRDPRWLETKVVDKDDTGKVLATHTPRSDVMEGRLSMKEAQERPGFWIAAPEGSEYGGFEQMYQRAAKRHGTTPAGAQALAWYGSADVGALKTKPELYLQNLERMVRQRAAATGQRPAQVLAQFLRGKEHLAVGGIGTGLGAEALMDDEQTTD